MTKPRPHLGITVAALATSTFLATPALAQASGESTQHHRSAHEDDAGEIVVVGHPPTDFGLLESSVTLEGDDLVARMQGQVGDMLSRLPGVSASGFAPGASRPVLRGFDGDRIRVLVDGIGTIDASNVSADHAVVFDALTVDHIDVLHGPAVLLFGGQAIGGAVNALDKRIPRSVPDAIQVTGIASYGTAAREKSAGGAVQVPLAERLVVHADASWRKSDDLRIGGHVASRALRADLLADAAEHRADGEPEEAEELEELAGLKGHIPNSGSRNITFGAGIAFIDAGGNLGLSFQRTDSRYGVPLRPGAGHGHHDEEHEAEVATLAAAAQEHGDEDVTIDLVQTRVDLRGAVEMGGFIDSLQLRGAYGDYRHTEFEGDSRGTVFSGEGYEFRADLVQANRSGWRGRSGVQMQSRKLTIVGPEAFTPDNEVSRIGLFTLQSVELGGGFEAEAAGRYERARIKAQSIGFDRSFGLWSGAAGLSWSGGGWKLGANFIRGARAPAPEELLSDGIHVATQAYELGDPTFRRETSRSLEAYIRYADDRVSLSLTGYHTRFSGFIAALPTGAEQEELPVFAYRQLPARFAGFEAEASWTAMRWDGGELSLDAAADYTRARLKGVGPVPRIPPLRLRGGAEAKFGAMHLRGEVEWNDAQDRVAAFENPVRSFTMVNLSADWHPLGEDGPLTLILAANNLFDVVGRRAASFTRDFVPLAGRDVRLTAKISF